MVYCSLFPKNEYISNRSCKEHPHKPWGFHGKVQAWSSIHYLHQWGAHTGHFPIDSNTVVLLGVTLGAWGRKDTGNLSGGTGQSQMWVLGSAALFAPGMGGRSRFWGGSGKWVGGGRAAAKSRLSKLELPSGRETETAFSWPLPSTWSDNTLSREHWRCPNSCSHQGKKTNPSVSFHFILISTQSTLLHVSAMVLPEWALCSWASVGKLKVPLARILTWT